MPRRISVTFCLSNIIIIFYFYYYIITFFITLPQSSAESGMALHVVWEAPKHGGKNTQLLKNRDGLDRPLPAWPDDNNYNQSYSFKNKV